MHTESIQDLEVLLGHSFRDKNFLLNALSHSSIKTDDRPSNERLEFLGDSVLGLIISDALYRRYPEDDEGTLTRIKSQAVSRSTLQRIAVAMGLDRHILVGKGVAKREIPASLLGNLFEAIVGAIYLDAGLASARKFILRHLDVIIGEIVEDRAERNYKSMLQHYCQREMGTVPGYRLLREAGPSHHRTFDVAVMLNGREFGRARGDSKKEAEQGSARAALLHFRAVDETPNQTVRGAGVVLRIGPDEGGRRGRRQEPEGRRQEPVGRGQEQGARGQPQQPEAAPVSHGEPAAAAMGDEPGAPEAHPGEPGQGRRRRRRRGGRGRRRGGQGPGQPPMQQQQLGTWPEETLPSEHAFAADAPPAPEPPPPPEPAPVHEPEEAAPAETAGEPEGAAPTEAAPAEGGRRRPSRRRGRRGRGKKPSAPDASAQP
jgi:ribonuclease III